MASLVNSDILRLVARLVLGYLDEQNLPDAYTVFCETSRHLTKEYLAYKEGAKSIDTSIGLVNIISEYFLLKEKLNEFIRTCPKTTLIIQLIDTSSIQLRLELIFKILKENLVKIDGNPNVEAAAAAVVSRKRKNEGVIEGFNVSQSNASTPESSQQPMKKRRRISLTTPFISVSATTNNKQVSADRSVLNRKELNYISSPETSNKEDDEVTEDEQQPTKGQTSAKISVPPLDILSETVLKKTDFVENLAEFINQTRSAKELDTTEASSSQTATLTQIDVQDILSKTEPDFEDILKEVIDKYLDPSEANQSTENSPSKEDEPEVGELKPEEIPIKQRLRQRSAKKITPVSEKKKKKKFNIISNEPYTGPMPLCLASTSAAAAQLIPQFIEPPQQSIILNLVPIMQQNSQFIPIATSQAPSSAIQESENAQEIILEPSPPVDLDKENKPSEKPHQTPKVSGISTSFLESKCKSTPRRKATHVRILDFNQTPRLSTLKEFSTPTSGIKMDTPGSAPPALLTEQRPPRVITEESIEIIDDSSNSTSISHTPKVAKNRRRRKIEIDNKKVEESPAKEPPMTKEEWVKMREQQKSLSLDERIRMMVSKENEKGENAERNKKKKKKKTPKKKVAVNVEVKIERDKPTTSKKSPITRVGGSSGAKFKVTSPRKAALLRKTPNKKKKLSKSPVFSVKSILTPNIDAIKQQKPEEPEKKTEEVVKEPEKAQTDEKSSEKKEIPKESELFDKNRSESVLEVANLLTHFPETILAKTNSGQNFEDKIDPNILLETPLKLDTSMSPLPNTPRFAVPLVTTTTHETPMPKVIATTTSVAISSIVKICDILTPSFPITPGFKDQTPLKSDHSPTSGGGYSSRRTDYSSCSSYYKPDESEEVNQNLDIIIRQSRERNSQSESEETVSLKIRVGSAKKVECPAALDRVQSFTEEKKVPHYTMMDEGLLSESILTTASSDNDTSSSSFTCSTCSTDPSTVDEISVDNLLNQSEIPETEDDVKDSEWHCKEIENEVAESNNSLVDEKTGELRFPLRNLMTPRKVEQEIKSILGNVQEVKDVPKESKTTVADLEAIKQRTLRILKNESSKKPPPTSKHKKSNEKSFKLPIEQPKSQPQTRREQILNRNLTERTRATPLSLIPSSSSSSRRKSATPRKTIVIDELPKAPSPVKKPRKARAKSESATTTKPERISLENISDNAVMNDDHLSLNSFEEPEVKKAEELAPVEESNTFQKAMIEQGFDKDEAKLLSEKFDKKEEEKEEGEMTDSETDEEECVFAFAEALEKNIVNVRESTGDRVKKNFQPLTKIPPAKLQVDEKTVKIDFSEAFEIYSMAPVEKKIEDKKQERRKELEKERARERERTRERESARKKITPKSLIASKDTNGKKEKANESKHLVNDMNIEKVLSMIHGNKK